jgi:hypothetical protein
VLAHAALFERVMNGLEAEQRRRGIRGARFGWARWGGAAVGLAAAAALALFIGSRREDEPEFAPRGVGRAGPAFYVECLAPAGGSVCVTGGKLTFRVTPSPERPFFAAFARRQDGVILWYLPEANAASARVSNPQLAVGFALDAQQPPGDYELFGVFSAEPLRREDVARRLADDLDPKDGSLSVVRQRFHVGGPG